MTGPTPLAPPFLTPGARGGQGQGQAGPQQWEDGGDVGRQEFTCGDATCAIA